MMHPAIPVSMLALAAPAFAAVGDPLGRMDGTMLAQVTVHERLIIRVPRMGPARMATRESVPVPIRYKEKKGPKCIAAADLGGALIVEPGKVDLVLEGGKRLRAHLDDDCGPLDYYGGFYLRPAADGKVCAGRDVIRVRSGASCQISTFKTLQASR